MVENAMAKKTTAPEIDRALLLFPSALVAVRSAHRMSQKALAIASQVDQSHVCNIEKNRTATPSLEVVERLADALGVDTAQRKCLADTAAHDRILFVAHQSLSGLDLRLVSDSVQAAQILCEKERNGVASYMNQVVRSKRVLAQACEGRRLEVMQ